MTIYNYKNPIPDHETLQSIGNLLSSVLFTVELHQGFLIQQDILECSFNLTTDGVIILNSTGTVTKLNKSAEIMLNT